MLPTLACFECRELRSLFRPSITSYAWCLLLNYDVARTPKSRCFKLSKIRSREWQTIRYMRVESLAGYPANNVAFPGRVDPGRPRRAVSRGSAIGGPGVTSSGPWTPALRRLRRLRPGIASSGSWRCLPASRPASRRSGRAACSRGDANTCSIIDKFA
jgi:hypothetical protein